MSVLTKIKDIFGDKIGLGNYSNIPYESGVYGKVMFAGGKHLPYEERPRNVMGSEILCVEVFKVILRSNEYSVLEENFTAIKTSLKKAGFIQISGFEHIDTEEGVPLQLAVSFKWLKQT